MDPAQAELARAKARVMADVAASLRELVPRLPLTDSAGEWRGPAQRAFENTLAQQLHHLRAVAASCDVASDALLGLATRLESP